MEYSPYNLWKQNFYLRHLEIDEQVQDFLGVPRASQWLRQTRGAKLLSSRRMAKALGISLASYLRIERLESSGKVSLKTLQQAAEVMGCELVYAIRPKQRKLFSRILWDHLVANLRFRPENPFSLARQAGELMHDPEFRRKQGWSRNTHGEGVGYQIHFNRLRAAGRNAIRRPE